MVSTMNNPHNFLPGDRVQTTSKTTLPSMIGTVIATPDDMRGRVWPEHVFVSFDNDINPLNRYRHWRADEGYFEPVPVKPGDLVRVCGPSNEIVEKYAGLIAKVKKIGEDYIETEKFGPLACSTWSIGNLRVVANPTESTADQVDRLAMFIMHNIPGEPSKSESAVDCAIRIMTEQRDSLRICNMGIEEAAKLLRRYRPSTPGWLPGTMKWLDRFDPAFAPFFKRGDLVTWGNGSVNYFIVNDDPESANPEIMSEDGRHFRQDIPRSIFRHVKK